MPGAWTAEDERRLLLAIIDASTKPSWDTISSVMGVYTAEACRPNASCWEKIAEKIGHGVNGNACSQKFNKLKKESQKILENVGAEAAAPATPAAKRPNATATKPARSKGNGKRKSLNHDAGNDDEDAAADDLDPPAAKKGKKAKPSAKKIKAMDIPEESDIKINDESVTLKHDSSEESVVMANSD